MKIIFELTKEDIEHIIIDKFQELGYEPEVKISGSSVATVEVGCDIERLDHNFLS